MEKVTFKASEFFINDSTFFVSLGIDNIITFSVFYKPFFRDGKMYYRNIVSIDSDYTSLTVNLGGRISEDNLKERSNKDWITFYVKQALGQIKRGSQTLKEFKKDVDPEFKNSPSMKIYHKELQDKYYQLSSYFGIFTFDDLMNKISEVEKSLY